MVIMAKFVLMYLSMSGNTRSIAEYIAEGARSMDIEVLMPDFYEAGIEDILSADAIGIGSPTYEHKAMAPIEKLLDRLKNKHMNGIIGVAFGSYGWSGEAPIQIAEKMRSMGITVVDPVIRIMYGPDEKEAETCRLLGKDVASRIKKARQIKVI